MSSLLLSSGALAKNGSFGFAKGRLVCRAKPNVPFVSGQILSACLSFVVRSNRLAPNEQVLPMVGNFIFVRSEPLPGFLIKLNIKN